MEKKIEMLEGIIKTYAESELKNTQKIKEYERRILELETTIMQLQEMLFEEKSKNTLAVKHF